MNDVFEAMRGSRLEDVTFQRFSFSLTFRNSGPNVRRYCLSSGAEADFVEQLSAKLYPAVEATLDAITEVSEGFELRFAGLGRVILLPRCEHTDYALTIDATDEATGEALGYYLI